MNIANKKILVTGADGFIGSHLTEMLCARGAQVRALCLYNSFNHWGWLEGSPCLDRVEIVTGDVRDPAFVRSAVAGCDIVFHLAALIAIPYSYVAPDNYVQTNVTGTLNVMQAARELGVQRVLHTSTSEVYGTARRVPIDEDHPLQAQSPYSATKIGADAIAYSFFSAFGLPVTIARPFNTYGPRQSARAVIPTVITQIAAGAQSIRLGSLHPTRDFNYVEDTCRGFVALAECDKALGEAVNIGSNAEISIGDTVALIQELMGSQTAIETDDARIRPEASEVERLWCDNTRIRALTGYAPQVSLREGLKRTIDWFAQPENLKRYKTGVYNL
ncbi:MAG: NAD-dependent dehydratase [Betaproteobacteria bacterium]|nr:NAD-dependent dehydratase [Betaproteobacteria bacterium]